MRPNSSFSSALCVPLLALAAACAPSSPHDIGWVSHQLVEQTGRGLAAQGDAAADSLPEGVVLSDGLGEDEAIALALWRNAAFRTDLAALELARADLLQAGLLADPVVSLLFPVGVKQLEASASWSIDALFRRPRRVRAARLETERVAEQLVQRGLDLVRDVRLAFAEALATRAGERWAADDARLAGEIAGIAAARLRSGDLSELETRAAWLAAERAEDEASRRAAAADLARERLRALLGVGELPAELQAAAAAPADAADDDLDALLERASARRPDLRAAQRALEAAKQHASWERSGRLGLQALADHNEKGTKGPETGPGLALRLPLFDANRGAVARAEAELERARRHASALRARVDLEVREAQRSHHQARDTHARWSAQILPELERSAAATARAERGGEVSQLAVLESEREVVAARLRAVEAEAALRRARAELDRSVGAGGRL